MTNPTRRPDWNALTLAELFDALARDDAERAISAALAEDLGDAGDVTTMSCFSEEARGRARIVSRAEGILAGVRVAEMIAARAGLSFRALVEDGSPVGRGTPIAAVEGPLRALLSHERTMLNFLTFLSGSATLAAQFVDAVRDTRARICDTRKTVPGLRTLQKYATRCGGATLHRIGLFDGVILKDNHLAAFAGMPLADRVRAAAERARAIAPVAFIECEVDDLSQLDALLSLERGVIDLILLDNMDAGMLTEAVRRRDRAQAAVELEASGGVRLDTVRRIASSGVERISVGAITHSAGALDLGLDLEFDLPEFDLPAGHRR
jgi:nicotinate-nucleotide pyrophosphorylase (carboxylating)